MTSRHIIGNRLEAEKSSSIVGARCLCTILIFLLSATWLGMPITLAAELPTATITVLDLQPFRRVSKVGIKMAGGGKGTATLTELNPRINAWYLLELDWQDPGESRLLHHASYHLENPDPHGLKDIRLDASVGGLHLRLDGESLDCALWTGVPTTQLEKAQKSALPYAPMCNDRMYLRNRVAGTYTRIESVTNFLRDHVWGGDRIVGFVRDQFFEDAFIERAETSATVGTTGVEGVPPDAPAPAQLAPDFANRTLIPDHLGIDVEKQSRILGRWYPVRDAPGIYVSAIKPEAIDAGLLQSARANVNSLDSVESKAVDYLVAFDLNRFDMGFALGTDHPRVGWSERVLDKIRDSRPGPDGIDTVTPLVTNGMLSPTLVSRIAATFTGGFKREHGAFHYGPLALVNYGSHYGFIEQGTVFSKLQSGLSTFYVLDDGTVGMKTWVDSDNAALLPRLRHARQNGVALIEYDPATAYSKPGALVNRWGAGNWSGSDHEDLRTLRAGVCLVEEKGRRFLVYGYLSAATPSAMARVFQAYGCRYAMHLDMNALEHTYLAVYTHKNDKVMVQHLIQGMAEVDRKGGNGDYAPRFLNYPDDRDFFYVLPKKMQK